MDQRHPDDEAFVHPHRGHQAGASRSGVRPLRLVVERGPDAGRSFVVGAAGATIGRAEDSTIVLSDPTVSRAHARLEPRVGALAVRDAGSRHGTRRNGRPVGAPQPLRPGDTLELGDTCLRVERAGRAPIPAGPAEQAAAPVAVYRVAGHERGPSRGPVYALRAGGLYRLPWHERGPGRRPDYALRAGRLYRTAYHELGESRTPDYALRAGGLYRTRWHPRGASATPDYRLAPPGAPLVGGEEDEHG